MKSTKKLSRLVKKALPKATIEQTRSGGWRIFVGGAAGRLSSLVLLDEEADTLRFVVGLHESRVYASGDARIMVDDLVEAFVKARGVSDWRSGGRDT